MHNGVATACAAPFWMDLPEDRSPSGTTEGHGCPENHGPVCQQITPGMFLLFSTCLLAASSDITNTVRLQHPVRWLHGQCGQNRTELLYRLQCHIHNISCSPCVPLEWTLAKLVYERVPPVAVEAVRSPKSKPWSTSPVIPMADLTSLRKKA